MEDMNANHSKRDFKSFEMRFSQYLYAISNFYFPFYALMACKI